MAERFLVFSTASYAWFAEGLCKQDSFEKGALEREIFPDGERYLRFSDSVRGRDVMVIGGTVSDSDTLELYDLAFGIVQHGARILTLIVPYYGYSTMERSSKPGEVVTGKTRAVLLSSIPEAQVCNEIVMIDLHTGGIPHYFEGAIRPYHLSGKQVIRDMMSSLSGDLVLASTDAGRAKWIEQMALEFDLPAAFVYKQRLSGSQTQISGINADVSGKHVVIYDDMIRTGGSLIGAARAYKEAGAAKITAMATHAVLPGGALDRLRESGLFDKVMVSDSHPRAMELAKDPCDFFEVRSMIPEISRFMRHRESYGADDYLDI